MPERQTTGKTEAGDERSLSQKNYRKKDVPSAKTRNENAIDEKKFESLVSADSPIMQFTLRIVLLGILMAVFMGAASACLDLKAGMMVAATTTLPPSSL